MPIAKRVDYGIRVLVELARNYNRGLIQSSEIALRQDIPGPYLEQILTHLRKRGFIISRRGPQGGHALSRPPSQINLGEVLGALTETFSLRCVPEPSDCPRSFVCVQRDVWQKIEQAISQLLKTITIAQLAELEDKQGGHTCPL